jgi:hypothetical protein
MKGHFLANKKLEITLGVIAFAIGSLLLWDAWEKRGKGSPFPLGILMPF